MCLVLAFERLLCPHLPLILPFEASFLTLTLLAVSDEDNRLVLRPRVSVDPQ